MKIFIVCFMSWFIAQVLKVIINYVKYLVGKRKGINRSKVTLETLFKLGGMPSSHTATVIALCGCVGMHSGWDSDVYAACGVFAFIVMFDAVKVRLPIGRLTDAFNRLQAKVCGSDEPAVKKVEGHTVPEIIGGFIVGGVLAWLLVTGLHAFRGKSLTWRTTVYGITVFVVVVAIIVGCNAGNPLMHMSLLYQ